MRLFRKTHVALMVLGGCLLGTGAIAFWLSVVENVREPLIIVEPRYLELRVTDGKNEPPLQVRVANGGSDALIIHEVTTDCSCLATEWPKSLAPREEGAVKLRVQSPVPVERAVRVKIRSNAFKEPVATVHIHLRSAERLPRVLARAEKLSWLGRFRTLPDKPVLVSIDTYEPADAPVWLEEIACDSRQFTAELCRPITKQLDDPKTVFRRYELQVRLRQALVVGPISGTVAFLSSGREVHRVEIGGEKLAAVFAVPDKLYGSLGLSNSQLPEWNLFLSGPEGFDLQTSIKLPAELEPWVAVERVSSKQWKLAVRKEPPHNLRSRITVQTNHSESPELPVGLVLLKPSSSTSENAEKQ